MAQYIDKDALVAEIERRIFNLEQLWKLGNKKYIETHFTGQFRDIKVYEGIIDFINTLEVKEVDLEKVFNDEYSKFSNDIDAMDYAFPIDLADYKDFAKHFFELGMEVRNNAQKGE